MTLILESSSKADLDDRQIIFRKQLFRTFDALLHKELLWREAGRFSKRTGEMKLAQIGDGRDFRETEIFFEILGDEFLYATKFVTRKSTDHALCPRLRSAVMIHQV